MEYPFQTSGKAFIALVVTYSITVASMAGAAGYYVGFRTAIASQAHAGVVIDEEEVLPSEGVEIPVEWADVGQRLTESGAIDKDAFLALYESRESLAEDAVRLLDGQDRGKMIITPENALLWLNLLWAFGLANQNEILENGPMQDEQYGGAEGFASTGGWSLAVGDTMNHYSRYQFVSLTPEQQERVVNVSQGIYRPCCGNSTYFPDCNHGMAMLGLLELMAAQDMSEGDMYQYALRVNAYWFPQTYLTIAKYFAEQGISWSEVDAQEVLGYDFSSGSGYQNILSQVEPARGQAGGSCGV